MKPLILDKPMAERLAKIAGGDRVDGKSQELLWSIALHDGCLVPPFFNAAVYDRLSVLENDGIVEFQDKALWDSFRVSLNPVLSDFVELHNRCETRCVPKTQLKDGMSIYGLGIGEITEDLLVAESVMSKNVKGLAGVIKNFAKTWNTGLSQSSTGLFSDLHCPDFVSTLGNMPESVLKSPTYLDDWASWFGDAWTEHIHEWVDEHFAFWRLIFTNLDDAHIELSERFGKSFKYFCKRHRISLPEQWTSSSPAQERFEQALESYLFDVAEEICKTSSQFPVFWDLAYKTLYLTSEAEFYDASLCTSGSRGINPRSREATAGDESHLQIVKVVSEESIAFPRIGCFNDLQRLMQDSRFEAVREKVWEWKAECVSGNGLNADDLRREIRADLSAYRRLPKLRRRSDLFNCLAMAASALDVLLSTCISAAFIPIGVYYLQRLNSVERQTAWCMVGDGG